MKIKHNLLIVILAISLIPLIVFSVFSIYDITSVSTTANEKIVQNTSENQVNSISKFFSEIVLTSKSLASDINLVSFSNLNNLTSRNAQQEKDFKKYEDLVSSRISALYQVDADVEEVLILDKNDNIVMVNSQYHSYESMKDKGMIENEINFKGDVKFDNVSGFSSFFQFNKLSNTCFFAHKSAILDNAGKNIGTSIIVYKTAYLQDVLNNSKSYKTFKSIIVDGGNMVFDYPYNYVSDFLSSNFYSDLASKCSGKSENGFYNYCNGNEELIAFCSTIPYSNWKVFNIINKSELSSTVSQEKLKSILLVLILPVIIIIISCIYVSNLTKPIEEMMFVLKKKQRGDKFATFKVSTKNEFGKISEAFNIMVDDISESEQRYRTVVEMSDNITFEYNIPKDFVRFSSNFNNKFSFRAKSEKYVDSFWQNCQTHPDDKLLYLETLKNAFQKANYVQGEFRFKTIYGDFIWILIRASMLYSREEKPYKVIGVMVDIDRAKKSEMKLIQRANYDSLTKLFNRETFEKRLANEFELSRMRKETNAVLFIDLDDFKNCNDTYGHAFGDEVLRYVSLTIKNAVEKIGFAGRYGGDEFVICISSQNILFDAQKLAKSLIETLKKGFVSEITQKNVKVNCSIGISMFDDTASNIDTVVEEADEAMYSVKKHGKSNFAVFNKNI